MMQVTKVWWDGEKLMAEPIDPAAVYKEPLDSLLDEAKLLADDRPVEIGHLPQWALDAEHMIRRLVKAFSTSPQPAQQEPVAWMTQARNFVPLNEFTEEEAKLYGWNALYTSPPAQRTWVGLTANEVEEIFQKKLGYYPTIYAVEAKLKEKNQ